MAFLPHSFVVTLIFLYFLLKKNQCANNNFRIIAALGIFISLQLPETYGQELLGSIEEAKIFHSRKSTETENS